MFILKIQQYLDFPLILFTIQIYHQGCVMASLKCKTTSYMYHYQIWWLPQNNTNELAILVIIFCSKIFSWTSYRAFFYRKAPFSFLSHNRRRILFRFSPQCIQHCPVQCPMKGWPVSADQFDPNMVQNCSPGHFCSHIYFIYIIFIYSPVLKYLVTHLRTLSPSLVWCNHNIGGDEKSSVFSWWNHIVRLVPDLAKIWC